MNYQIIAVISAAIAVGCLIGTGMLLNLLGKIIKQLEFIRDNRTNKPVSVYGGGRVVKKMVRTMNETLDTYREREIEISRTDKEIRDTITNMSHDIRTPLTSLKGYFELMKLSENEEEKARYETIVSERIDSLNELLDGLFEYSKVSNGYLDVKMEDINMSDIVSEVLLSYYDEFEKSNMEPDVSISENLHMVGDEKALKRILQNLIKNSLRYGHERAVIRLFRGGNGNMFFEIGNGFLSEDRPDINKVFDRFYVNDKSRHKGGSGIGLSVARKLTTLMDGSIKAKIENDGRGELFIISAEFIGVK